MKEIDYRELLVKYMAHLISIEGTAFVSCTNHHFSFEQAEIEVLKELEESADSKYFGL